MLRKPYCTFYHRWLAFHSKPHMCPQGLAASPSHSLQRQPSRGSKPRSYPRSTFLHKFLTCHNWFSLGDGMSSSRERCLSLQLLLCPRPVGQAPLPPNHFGCKPVHISIPGWWNPMVWVCYCVPPTVLKIPVSLSLISHPTLSIFLFYLLNFLMQSKAPLFSLWLWATCCIKGSKKKVQTECDRGAKSSQ